MGVVVMIIVVALMAERGGRTVLVSPLVFSIGVC